MALKAKDKERLAALGLPSDQEMIRRARAFALRSGLTVREMGEQAGLNPNSFGVWVSGNYDKNHPNDNNTLNIRAALKSYMDSHELASTPPSPVRHYPTSEYEAVRKSMLAALDQGTAFLVDGPPGTQKTYTLRRVVDEINRSHDGRAVYIYSRVDHSPTAFLTECCTEAGIPSRGTTDQLIRKLRFFLGSQRRRTLLAIDEAQHLQLGTLEVLRQLLDTPPFFGVVIGGSHDLSIRLRAWQMEQWRSRLRRSLVLKGLTRNEAAQILTGEFGSLSEEFIDQSIQDATVKAVRNKVPFEYISARNLFFAIEDAHNALAAAEQPNLEEVTA